MPLLAPSTVMIRSREQEPPNASGQATSDLVYGHFKGRPHDFEHFAAELMLLSDPNVDRIDVTRP